MEERPYRVLWVAALTPELTMIPGNDIFAYGTQKRSLTATAKGIPGLLLKESDPVLTSQDIRRRSSLDQAESKGTVRGKKLSAHANKRVRGKMKA